MKKISLLFLACLLVFSLAACGGSPAASSGTTAAPQDTSAPETGAPDTTAQTDAPEIPVFEEVVIVDDESCTFRITGIEEDSLWGYTLKAYLENKTDLDLMFSLSDVSVNGFMCDPLWAATVSAGMKSNEEISFPAQSFTLNGITSVTDITFTLDIYDSSDWTADHLVSDTFTIYPQGEAAVQTHQRTPVEGELVLFDDGNCAMIVTGFDPDNIWGYTMNVYLENKTDKTLMFSVDDAPVNGFMCDPFWAETVAPGKRSNTAISWLEEEFETNGIANVESLTLPITVYDANDLEANHLIDETFTVNP